MNKDYIKGLGTGIILTSAIFFIGFLVSPKETVIVEKNYTNVEETKKANEVVELSKEEPNTDVKEKPRNKTDEKDTETSSTEAQTEATEESKNESTETEVKEVVTLEDSQQVIDKPDKESITEQSSNDSLKDKESDDLSSSNENNYIEVKIPEGYTSNGVGIILQEHGIIDDYKAFNLYCVRNKVDNNLRSGIYAFQSSTSYEDIVKLMVK